MGIGGSNRVSYSRDTADGWIYRSWSHDIKGNATTDGIHTFTYDEANQPISSTGGAAAVSYAYHDDLKRVKSVVA